MATLLLLVPVRTRLLREMALSTNLYGVAAGATAFMHLLMVFAARGIKRGLTARSWTHQPLVGADHAPCSLDEGVAGGMVALTVPWRSPGILDWLWTLLAVR